ncbi:MAG: hypothetical protein DHS20C19_23300 [Acidimicrobiales bacterium]|nr:MAG: hypothetical protein DHS20C19_23300 [Acidimicrobiales bacterium]
MTTDGGWAIRRRTGSAASLHDPTEPDAAVPTVDILTVDEPSFVLGSSQSTAVVNDDRARSAGVVVARRRSGGGAVLLVPDEHVWIDAWIPAGDRRWDDDVIRAGDWLGDAWCSAARHWGFTDLRVHRTNATRDGWAESVCFAGAGPGEVFAGDRKLVGVSQRRTRRWTRLQSLVHRRWDAALTFGMLADEGAASAGVAWRDGVAAVEDVDVESVFLDVLDRT